MDRGEAKKLFAKMKGETFKLELIDAIPEGDEIKLYSQARMARSLPRPAYDLDGQGRQRLQVAQDRRRLLARGFNQPMLQRIYGTAWASEDDLKEKPSGRPPTNHAYDESSDARPIGCLRGPMLPRFRVATPAAPALLRMQRW